MAPAFIRLMFPLMKACGLFRSIATSIWSKDAPDGLYALAIRPAVSPFFTVMLRDDVGAGGVSS